MGWEPSLLERHNEDYHIAFGMHSGIPLCCIWDFIERWRKFHGWDPDPSNRCPKCRAAGKTELGYKPTGAMHLCSRDNPSCRTYLDLQKAWFKKAK